MPRNEDLSDDLALRAFMASADEVAPEIPKDLLRKAYAIQKTYQFDRDRETSLQATRKILEDFVVRSDRTATGGDAS